jgi:tetratricopeptide (TPR) repeat protein
LLCEEQGDEYVKSILYRQAFQQYFRASQLNPDKLRTRLQMARFDMMWGRPDDALRLASEINADQKRFDMTVKDLPDVVSIEIAAHLMKGEVPQAEAAAQAAMQQSPRNDSLLAAMAQIYINHRAWTNAAVLLEQQLEISPGNTNAWLNRGVVYIQLRQFEQAIKPLNEALRLEPGNYLARFNRAIAYLQAGQLEDARKDYEVLLKDFPKASQIYYGLGEIAYRQMDTNAAIRNYQLYLTNSPPSQEEAKIVAGRLKELKTGSR